MAQGGSKEARPLVPRRRRCRQLVCRLRMSCWPGGRRRWHRARAHGAPSHNRAACSERRASMRSVADADANIGLSKSQYFLPSELRAAKVIDNTADQTHRNGLPPRDRDINPLRPGARTQAAIDADPTHALHGVTTFGLGRHEQTPERIDELNAFRRARGHEISELSRNNCLTTGTSTPKLTRRSRKRNETLTPLPCMVRLRKATSEKVRSLFKTSSANIGGLTNMARRTI